MRVLQLARRFAKEDWGGTETVILETSKRLLVMGHKTEVLCTMATAKTDSDSIDGLSIRRFRYFYPYIGLSREAKHVLDKKGGSPFSFQLMRAIKRLPDLDLIHLHTGNRIGGIGRHVAKKRGIPYVVSLHGGVFDMPQEEAASLAAPTKGAFDFGKALGWWVGSRRVLQDANAILCVGYHESQLTQEHFPDKRVVYLPNGADTQRFARGDGPGFRRKHTIPNDARIVLTVARIDSQKNQLLPVRTLPELLKMAPNTHVLLIGNVTNRAYHEKLVQAVKKSNVEAHVTIIPGIAAGSRELVDAYHAANVFLLPSIHEPFGIVVLEAWAAGLPVIASNVGGIPHFVDNGKDGLLFDPDDERSFLDAFAAILRDKTFSANLAANGRNKARAEYDWDIMARRLVGIYEEVLDENSLR